MGLAVELAVVSVTVAAAVSAVLAAGFPSPLSVEAAVEFCPSSSSSFSSGSFTEGGSRWEGGRFAIGAGAVVLGSGLLVATTAGVAGGALGGGGAGVFLMLCSMLAAVAKSWGEGVPAGILAAAGVPAGIPVFLLAIAGVLCWTMGVAEGLSSPGRNIPVEGTPELGLAFGVLPMLWA